MSPSVCYQYPNRNDRRINETPRRITPSQVAARVGGRKNSCGGRRRVAGSVAGIRGEKQRQISGKARWSVRETNGARIPGTATTCRRATYTCLPTGRQTRRRCTCTVCAINTAKNL